MVDTHRMGIEEIDVEQYSWQKSANCHSAPSYVFFPEETLSPSFKSQPEMEGVTFKTFCGKCKVKRICLEFALLHDLSGIWGGTTDSERKNRFSPGEREEMRELKRETGFYKPLYGHS